MNIPVSVRLKPGLPRALGRTVVAVAIFAGALRGQTADFVHSIIGKLSGDEFEGRGAGYPGEKKAAEFVAAEFERIGLKPVGDQVEGRRTYFQEFKFHPRHPVVPWEMLTSRNVIGLLEGGDPNLKQEIVVIGAHYDGQGRIGQADPLRFDPANTGQNHPIWNSANDNATGVSAVIAAAQILASAHVPIKRSVLFVAFGCEEHGMSGSIQYVTNPAFPLSRHVAMITYEKLGRAPGQRLRAQGTATSSAWGEVIAKASASAAIELDPPIPYIIPDSDHYPFASSGIPAVVFSLSGADDAHTPADVAGKVDFERVAQFAGFGLAVVRELANRPSRLPYVDVRGRDPGLVAHLISDEEADRAGLKAPDSGLKVTGVIPGGSADRAGLQAGDLILPGAVLALRRGMSLQALQKMQMEIVSGQRGDHIAVTVVRDKKQLELTMDLRRP